MVVIPTFPRGQLVLHRHAFPLATVSVAAVSFRTLISFLGHVDDVLACTSPMDMRRIMALFLGLVS